MGGRQRRTGGHQVGGRSGEHHPAAVMARPRAQVDDPVRVSHHRLVVLDDDDRIAVVHEPVEQPEQLVHIGQMQPGRRLVQHIRRAVLRHVDGELEPLPLTAGQGGQRLAEPEIAEAHRPSAGRGSNRG